MVVVTAFRCDTCLLLFVIALNLVLHRDAKHCDAADKTQNNAPQFVTHADVSRRAVSSGFQRVWIKDERNATSFDAFVDLLKARPWREETALRAAVRSWMLMRRMAASRHRAEHATAPIDVPPCHNQRAGHHKHASPQVVPSCSTVAVPPPPVGIDDIAVGTPHSPLLRGRYLAYALRLFAAGKATPDTLDAVIAQVGQGFADFVRQVTKGVRQALTYDHPEGCPVLPCTYEVKDVNGDVSEVVQCPVPCGPPLCQDDDASAPRVMGAAGLPGASVASATPTMVKVRMVARECLSNDINVAVAPKTECLTIKQAAYNEASDVVTVTVEGRDDPMTIPLGLGAEHGEE